MKRIRFRHKQLQKQRQKDIFPVNEKIRVPELRVIDENGEMLGVLPTYKALQIAKEREYDLVAVSPKAKPPVAKFLDYGSFKYQQEKAAKKQKAQAKRSEVKSIRLSARIGKHDIDVRLKQAEKFLKKGDKVSIDLVVKGRERQHPEVSKGVLEDFINTINNEIIPIKYEQEIKRQGNKFSAIILPDYKEIEAKREADKKAKEDEKNQDKADSDQEKKQQVEEKQEKEDKPLDEK